MRPRPGGGAAIQGESCSKARNSHTSGDWRRPPGARSQRLRKPDSVFRQERDDLARCSHDLRGCGSQDSFPFPRKGAAPPGVRSAFPASWLLLFTLAAHRPSLGITVVLFGGVAGPPPSYHWCCIMLMLHLRVTPHNLSVPVTLPSVCASMSLHQIWVIVEQK